MKITALETFLVPPRWLFIKLSTDSGLSGWGEPVVEGHARAVAEAVHEASDYLIVHAWHNPVWRLDDGTIAEW